MAEGQTKEKQNTPIPLHKLGECVHGLDLFTWLLPAAFLIDALTVFTHLLDAFGILLVGLVHFFLWENATKLETTLSKETFYAKHVQRLKVLSLTLFGLAPFLYWYKADPENLQFALSVGVFGLMGGVFFITLNLFLRGLAAEITDQESQMEIRILTQWNTISFGVVTLLFLLLYSARIWVMHHPETERFLFWPRDSLHPARFFCIALSIPPVALTGLIAWKVRTAIWNRVFQTLERVSEGKEILPKESNKASLMAEEEQGSTCIQ